MIMMTHYLKVINTTTTSVWVLQEPSTFNNQSVDGSPLCHQTMSVEYSCDQGLFNKARDSFPGTGATTFRAGETWGPQSRMELAL